MDGENLEAAGVTVGGVDRVDPVDVPKGKTFFVAEPREWVSLYNELVEALLGEDKRNRLAEDAVSLESMHRIVIGHATQLRDALGGGLEDFKRSKAACVQLESDNSFLLEEERQLKAALGDERKEKARLKKALGDATEREERLKEKVAELEYQIEGLDVMVAERDAVISESLIRTMHRKAAEANAADRAAG